MSDGQVFPVPEAWAKRAHMNAAGYEAAWKRGRGRSRGLLARRRRAGSTGSSRSPQVKDVSYDADDFRIRWFADGVLNASANCLDRHLPHRAGDIAIIWEGDDPKDSRKITYAEAHAEICRMANVLKAHGVKKGDRVTIYLPMIPEAAYAMLACARIGAIHSVIFGGFSPDSIAGRIQDCDFQRRHHRRRGPARRPHRAAEEERRRGAGQPARTSTDVIVVKRTGAEVAHAAGPRLLVRRGARQGLRRLPARADGRRGPALHPLHLRLDRKAEGRAAHHRRLPDLGRPHPRAGVRLPPRRGLLVHRRRRLGDRPQLHRLRPARERRDHADLRGRAQLSDQLAASGR